MKQENLNPEIEEKLLNLQRYQEKQMKGEQQSTSVALIHNHHEYTSPIKQSPARKRPSSRTQPGDDDWQLDTPKRRPPRTSSMSDKKISPAASAAIETDVNRIIRSVEEETATETESKSTKIITTPSPSKPVNNNRRLAAIKRESEKKKQQQQLQVSVWFILIL